MLVSALLTE